MPRTARIVIPEVPHHITHRGKNQKAIFIDDLDRRSYLSILRKRSAEVGLEIHGYCLLINHIHLIATPSEEDTLAKAVGYAHRMYSKGFNERHNRKGLNLWHDRFYSCPLDEAHFLEALIYVDRNPVRAGLVELPWLYRWSSAGAHMDGDDPARLVDSEKWSRIAEDYDWKAVIRQKQDERVVLEIRQHTQSGRPLGKL